MAAYVYDNAWQAAQRRLMALEALWDPGTIRHLEALGVGAGWHCLEVGGGAGSITAWLCQHVGPSGAVLATDVDTRFLEALDYPNLEVRRHDLACDDLPRDAFDLIHTRLVLSHVPERDEVVGRLVAALRPGGWLLAEEVDTVTVNVDPAVGPAAVALWEKGRAAIRTIFQGTSLDPAYGRRLYGAVSAQGLSEVGVEGRSYLVRGGTPRAEGYRLSLEQLRDRLVGSGQLTPAEMEALLALRRDPAVCFMTDTLVAVWGRRPLGEL
jgi:SAM-dependent methyltransferase